MEVGFDGLAALLRGQSAEWVLAAAFLIQRLLIQSLAVLILAITVFAQRTGSSRR